MAKKLVRNLVAAAMLLGSAVAPASAQQPVAFAAQADVGFIKLDKNITLRRMVLRNSKAKGAILLLHGFPETLYTWQHLSQLLASEYEVHAFDWPGYGQSSRPAADKFAYAPRDYARVLRQYVRKARLDGKKLTIYATDIGALPVLLASIEKPDIARTIIVGDFAPFNRPQYMHERLERLKSKPSSDVARAQLNAGRDDTLENAFRRGLSKEAQFDLSLEFREDMARGWGNGALTSADAFYHYYSHFTRDEDFLEANLKRLKTPVRVVWGADDIYIKKEMGLEFAMRTGAEISLLPGIGHYGHLQSPQLIAKEIRGSRP